MHVAGILKEGEKNVPQFISATLSFSDLERVRTAGAVRNYQDSRVLNETGRIFFQQINNISFLY